MEKRHQKNIYHSEKILGQLYDIAQLVKFIPAYDTPFDRRILDAYDLELETLQQARELKDEYDTRMKRIMAQHDVETEFEVWSSFVMTHNQEKSDYSFAEELGKIMLAVKDHFRKLCKDKVDGLEPVAFSRFVAAIYTVTASEVAAAVEKCKQTKSTTGEELPAHIMTPKSMPLISFPWIFDRELGKIANGTFLSRDAITGQGVQRQSEPKAKSLSPQPAGLNTIKIETDAGVIPEGEVLNIFDEETSITTSSGVIDRRTSKAKGKESTKYEPHGDCNNMKEKEEVEVKASNENEDAERPSVMSRLNRLSRSMQSEVASDDVRGSLLADYGIEEIRINLDGSGPSSLELLAQLVGTDDSSDSESDEN
jgi:hypothetical protein